MQMLTWVIVKRTENEIFWWGREMGWGGFTRCARFKDHDEAQEVFDNLDEECNLVYLNEDEIALLDVLAASVGLNGLLV